MRKREKQTRNLSSYQLGEVTGGVVPIVLGKSIDDEVNTSRASSELGLTTVEQQR